MQVKINPDSPGIFGALLDAENKKSISSMHTILRESLYTDANEKLTLEQADKYLRSMSYNTMNEMGEKFMKAMEALRAEALPPNSGAPSL